MRDDRGSVLAEFALALPILALLVLGILDYGMAWQEGNQIERAASVAARTGSGKATAPEADEDVLLSIASTFSSLDNVELDRVIVYNSETTDGAVPASCLALSSGSVTDVCNVYTGAQARSGTSFCTSAPTTGWCPGRRDAKEPGRDYLGVYIEATYSPMTGIIPGEMTIERHAVYLLEPESISGVGT